MNTYTYKANGRVIFRHHGDSAEEADKKFRSRFGDKRAERTEQPVKTVVRYKAFMKHEYMGDCELHDGYEGYSTAEQATAAGEEAMSYDLSYKGFEVRPYDAPCRPCGSPDCHVSTGIHEGLTFGSGELDQYGYWEKPCAVCARQAEEDDPQQYPCWPYEEKDKVDKARRKRLRKEGLLLEFFGIDAEKQFEIVCRLADPAGKQYHRPNKGNILRKWVENPTDLLKRRLKNFLLRQWEIKNFNRRQWEQCEFKG